MSQQAIIAIKAAKMRKQVGRWASMKFAIVGILSSLGLAVATN